MVKVAEKGELKKGQSVQLPLFMILILLICSVKDYLSNISFFVCVKLAVWIR